MLIFFKQIFVNLVNKWWLFRWGPHVWSQVLHSHVIWQDADNNRIGQWLNETSNSKILQLSYDLNSEAREGHYQVIVTTGLEKINHNFKVEKYGEIWINYIVLPFFQSINNEAIMLMNTFCPQFFLNMK